MATDMPKDAKGEPVLMNYDEVAARFACAVAGFLLMLLIVVGMYASREHRRADEAQRTIVILHGGMPVP